MSNKYSPKEFRQLIGRKVKTLQKWDREVAISRDARGNYYASFSYHKEEQMPKPGEAVAFDLGIKTLATLQANVSLY